MEYRRSLEMQIRETLKCVDESEFESLKDYVEYVIEDLIMYSNGLQEDGEFEL
jgi:hypothetical protein